MAELDPNLILQGVATTHPVLARPLGDTLEQGAHTAEIQAQTGLVHQETAGAGLQNYIAQMNLRNAQIMGTAQMALFNQIRAKSAQGYSPPAGGVTGPAVTPGASSSTPPAATGTAPPPFLAAGPGQPGYQPPAGPGAQPAPNPANAGVIDPNNPPPPPGVTPYAWDYANKNGYKIDTAHDWYTKDDLPISHYSGPELTPAGRPNMLSADMQLQLGDIMQRMGAQPQFIAGLINNGLIKAQAFDAQASKIYQDQASAADSLAKANESNQKVQIAAKNFRADSADGILNSPNPLASLQQDMGAHPHMWDPTLAAVGIAPGQFNPADPKQQGVVLQTLQGLQSTSPQYIDRMSKQAAATAAGVHELHEIDPNTGFPVTSLVQVGSAGAGIAPGLPGATGGPQVNTLVKGTLPAGSESLLDAQAQAIAEYRLPPIQYARTPSQIIINNKALMLNPNLSMPAYQAYQAGLKGFTAGTGLQSPASQIQTFNTIAEHTNLLQQLSNAYSRGDNQLVNKAQAALSATFGGTAVPNLQAAAQLVGAEISKAIVGGQTSLGDRENSTGLWDPKLSSTQLNNIMGVMQNAVGGKFYSLYRRWLSILPPDAPVAIRVAHDAQFTGKLTPNAQVLFNNAKEQSEANLTKINAVNGINTPPAAPPLGTTRGNFQFSGGDPSNQSNWKAIK